MRKILEKKHVGKNSIVTGILLLFCLLFVTISCALPQDKMTMSFPKDSELLPLTTIQSLHNLEKQGQRYVPVDGDSYIVFRFASQEAQSVSIQFNNAPELNEGSQVKLYYSKDGNFTEKDATTASTGLSENTYLFRLPTDTYSFFRLDVDGAFAINEVLISTEPLAFSTIKQDANLLRMSTAIILPLLITAILLLSGQLSKMADGFLNKSRLFKKFIKKHKLDILTSGGIYILIATVSVVAELIYFRIVDKIPNSLGMHFDFFRFMFIFAVLATVFTLFLFRKIAGKKPEYLFLTVAIIGGILFTTGLPAVPGPSWDEHIHYRFATTASVVSDGSYTLADENNFELRKSFEDLYEYRESVDYAKEQNQLDKLGSIDEKKESPLNFYQRLGNIPAAITMKTSDAVGIPFTAQILLARTANLLVYALLMFFAIKKLSSGKMILSVLALVPTLIFLASVFSYDYWVTAFITLGFVYYLEELRHPDRLMSLKNLLIMLSCFILGCGPKAVYFIFFLFPLFMKKEKMYDVKKCRWLTLGSLAVVVISLGLSLVLAIDVGGDFRGGADVSSSGQILYIFSHPVEYTKTLLSFLNNYWSPEIFSGSKYFTFLAYLPGSIKMGATTLLILLGIVSFTDKNERDQHSSKWYTRLLVALVAFAGTALVATTLYISFTPVGLNTINGCQPRYIFPFLFPILSVIGSSKIVNRIDRKMYNYVIISISAGILYLGIWQSCLTFYH